MGRGRARERDGNGINRSSFTNAVYVIGNGNVDDESRRGN